MARRSEDTQSKPGGISRRTLITTSAGVATTAAVSAVAPGAAVAMTRQDAQAVPVAEPAAHLPHNPVVAYVRDAARGEVTIVSGKCEHTFRDKALVRRMLAAAGSCVHTTGGK